MPATPSSGSWDRQFAAKANAFNAGYERLKHLRFDLIGNLDDGTDDIVKSHAADVHWIELMRIPARQTASDGPNDGGPPQGSPCLLDLESTAWVSAHRPMRVSPRFAGPLNIRRYQ